MGNLEQSTSEKNLSDHCEEAAQFYIDRPGLFGPGVVIDLYRTCATLANRLDELEALCKSKVT